MQLNLEKYSAVIGPNIAEGGDEKQRVKYAIDLHL